MPTLVGVGKVLKQGKSMIIYIRKKNTLGDLQQFEKKEIVFIAFPIEEKTERQ